MEYVKGDFSTLLKRELDKVYALIIRDQGGSQRMESKKSDFIVDQVDLKGVVIGLLLLLSLILVI